MEECCCSFLVFVQYGESTEIFFLLCWKFHFLLGVAVGCQRFACFGDLSFSSMSRPCAWIPCAGRRKIHIKKTYDAGRNETKQDEARAEKLSDFPALRARLEERRAELQHMCKQITRKPLGIRLKYALQVSPELV